MCFCAISWEGSGSAVGHGVEGRADLLAAADTELAESSCEYGFRHGSEIVEGGDAVVIDSFVDADRDAGRDGPDAGRCRAAHHAP